MSRATGVFARKQMRRNLSAVQASRAGPASTPMPEVDDHPTCWFCGEDRVSRLKMGKLPAGLGYAYQCRDRTECERCRNL